MRFMTRFVAVVMLAGLLLGNAGCDYSAFSAGFVGGWLAATGNIFGTTETICYQNGVQVDCGSLPDSIAP